MTSTSDDNPPIVKVSDEIRSFYAEHGIDLVREFTTSKDGHGVRFVRLNPRFDREETIRQLKVSFELGFHYRALSVMHLRRHPRILLTWIILYRLRTNYRHRRGIISLYQSPGLILRSDFTPYLGISLCLNHLVFKVPACMVKMLARVLQWRRS